MRNIYSYNSHAVRSVFESARADRDFAEYACARSGLPSNLLDLESCELPQIACRRFGTLVLEHSGNPAFLWDLAMSGENPPTGRDSSADSVNRLKAISTFVRTLDQAGLDLGFRCYLDRKEMWFLREPMVAVDEDEWASESYVIGMYLKQVRQLLPDDWFPSKILLRSNAPVQSIPLEWRRAQLWCRQPFTAVAIPLERVVPDTGVVWDIDEGGSMSQRTASARVSRVERQAQVKKIVDAYVLSGEAQIYRPAAALGMSVRTFQRKLTELGLNYASMVLQSRLDRAKQLLVSSDQPIADIAYELGYKYHGDFTRAFTRCIKVPPRTYREESR